MDKKQGESKKIANGVFWKFVESIGTQGVSFIVSLVLARLLVPEDYGVVSVISIFIGIANMFLTSGLTTALVQKRELNQLEMSTVFYCNLLISLCLYGILFLLAPLVAKLYEQPILEPITRVLALRLPLQAFQAVQNALLSRELNFRKQFFCTAVGNFVSAVVGITMAFKGYGAWALVAQSLVCEFVNAVSLSIAIRWKPSFAFSLPAVTSMISYGWKVTLTDLIGTVFNNLSSMIIGLRYTTTDLAFYTKGKHIPGLVYTNVGNIVLSVLFPAMSRVNDDPAEIKKVAQHSLRMAYYVVAPIMVGMAAVSSDLIVLLYTEKWVNSIPFLCIACLESLLCLVSAVVFQTLRAVGRSDWMLRLEFFKKPAYLIIILVAMNFGVEVLALAASVYAVIELLLNGIYIKKAVNYSVLEQIRDCLPAVMIAGLMGVGVILVSKLHLPLLIGLAAQVAVGVLTYVILSFVFRIQEFEALKNILIGKLRRK